MADILSSLLCGYRAALREALLRVFLLVGCLGGGLVPATRPEGSAVVGNLLFT